jgi:hypothetical protein
VTVHIGTGSEHQIVYHTGYVGRAGEGDLQPVPLSGNASDVIENTWYRGMAQAKISMTGGDLASNHYILTYVCTWTPSPGWMPGGQWKCGCPDEACAEPRWTIQGFRGK